MAAFPMESPQYVIYVLVLQPKPDATTHGFTTGGMIAAPTVARVISRIGPMLGVLPETGDQLAASEAALMLPLAPTSPPGEIALGPGRPLPPGANAFAYQLMGQKAPGSAPGDAGIAKLRMQRPQTDLSASHGTGHSRVMAPVIGAANHLHMTMAAPVFAFPEPAGRQLAEC
jgi:cell division protein FtsI (penicillin-binding protein 3)